MLIILVSAFSICYHIIHIRYGERNSQLNFYYEEIEIELTLWFKNCVKAWNNLHR